MVPGVCATRVSNSHVAKNGAIRRLCCVPCNGRRTLGERFRDLSPFFILRVEHALGIVAVGAGVFAFGESILKEKKQRVCGA